MTTAVTTTTTTDISLAKLIPSPVNARRIGAGAGIEALAASIQAHGLLQSLVVRPKLDGSGEPTERYEVVAGGRRLAALKLLAKQKRVAKGAPIPCRVLDSEGVDGAEASLAENVVRQDMHPADQFEAFAHLHEGGTGVEDIAARFGVSAHTVRQRLRLACVSPALIQAYRDEVLTLDHLTAFAVTEDREAQERVFGQLQEWQRTPDTIRRLLTHALIPASDRKVIFVGLDAYTAAGGMVQRDLFSEDRGGWISDAALLERLVAERMEREADSVRAEGWCWVAIGPEAQSAAWACRRVWPSKVALSEADEARRGELGNRYDELAEEHNGTGEDLPEEVAVELDRIEAELAALDAKEEAWQPEDVAIAGVMLTLAADGSLRAERGYVRAEDEPKPEPVMADADGIETDGKTGTEDQGETPIGGTVTPIRSTPEPEDKAPALSATLLADLEAHRTAGLQAAIAGQSELAVRVLLHALATDAFYSRYGETVMALHVYPPRPRFRLPRHCRQPGSANHDGGRGRMAQPPAARTWGTVGMAAGPGRDDAAGPVGRVRGAHRERGQPHLDDAGRRAVHRGAGRDGSGAGYAAVLVVDQGQLPWPGAEGADPGRGTRGGRGERRQPDRQEQEGGHGGGRGTGPGRDQLASRSAARSRGDISRGLW